MGKESRVCRVKKPKEKVLKKKYWEEPFQKA
jgi:hypothetical protein